MNKTADDSRWRYSPLAGVWVLAAVVALANYLAWCWVGSSASSSPAPEIAPRVGGLAYAPFGRSDAPWVRHTPAATLLEEDLRQQATLTTQIRTYSAAQLPELPGIAARHGLQVTLGVWLNQDWASNRRELAAGTAAAARFPNVKRLIVGNETVLKKSLTPAQLIEHLQAARAAVKVPVSTAEPWHVWIKHPELADHVDFITIHLLPYWEGVGLTTAVEESFERMARVAARFPGKPIVIGEIGYPSGGDTIKEAVPSPAAQARFVRQFVERARLQKVDYFLMEAYDQPWKRHEEGRAGAFWGIYDAARVPKFAFTGAIERDPFWQRKALASSLAGFVFLGWFLTRLRSLRALAQAAYAATAQGVLSLATVVVTLPLLHYMGAGDWVMLALLLVTSLVMVAILLAHLFEFVELFWEGSLRRRFAPRPLPEDACQPRVSIHLACCNEPPEMVIATLKSLARLDYDEYEVIVVDNNTAEASLWQPVREHIAGLPANLRDKFQFHHLPTWPGYKAGALNFALTHTDARAEIIAVVDADYVVKRDWLRALVAHFDDPLVGVVQAPQAHRDWGGTAFRKMMNWEYEGFFRIGMHHRNERDAIIQHGTMTLIRATALRDFGQWSEWCLCEDTELGLRLLRRGLRTVYVDQVMGEGLTPDSFAAFKQQRARWAQGGMQILKAHWRGLLGHTGAGQSRLTLGQRYHFLAGWLPWIGDALHLIFVLAALAWTVAMLTLPQHFSLPVALFMLPLAVFCAAKLVIGPLLYWRRVPCTASGIVGAAIAGMGLSHAIARGVLKGFLRGTARFQITAKGGVGAARRSTNALDAVREELLLAIALVVAAGATALSAPKATESVLWIVMLALQSLPYFAALACALVAARPEPKVVARMPEEAIPERLLGQ